MADMYLVAPAIILVLIAVAAAAFILLRKEKPDRRDRRKMMIAGLAVMLAAAASAVFVVLAGMGALGPSDGSSALPFIPIWIAVFGGSFVLLTSRRGRKSPRDRKIMAALAAVFIIAIIVGLLAFFMF